MFLVVDDNKKEAFLKYYSGVPIQLTVSSPIVFGMLPKNQRSLQITDDTSGENRFNCDCELFSLSNENNVKSVIKIYFKGYV